MPETIVVATAFVVLLVDLAAMRQRPTRTRLRCGALLAGVGCLAAAFWPGASGPAGTTNYYDGLLILDPLTQLIQQAILLLTIFTALISIEGGFTDHVGEYFLLLLLATVGMMFLVSTANILMIFISLELLSLSLYLLTAFNKQNLASAEAALKYFLFGGMSAAIMLFGLSLVYGLSGELNLGKIAAKLVGPTLDPLLVVALVMLVTGFGFKVAAVPFHLWAPDAYQGAPTPSAAFIASGSKVASFYVLARVLMSGFHDAAGSGAWRGFSPGWVPLLAVVAAFSMVLGNLAAIAQKSVRRLLAYSAIAQAGYMLVGLLADNPQGLAALIFYAITYAFTILGAFAVVGAVQQAASGDGFAAFAGLRQRAPLLACSMMVFMLSLAGIPPLVGFFGKFYLFTAAVHSAPANLGLLWLVVLAIAMSAVSLYYYLQVLKQIFVTAAPAGSPSIEVSLSTNILVTLLALGALVVGGAPNLLLGRLVALIK